MQRTSVHVVSYIEGAVSGSRRVVVVYSDNSDRTAVSLALCADPGLLFYRSQLRSRSSQGEGKKDTASAGRSMLYA